MIDPLSDVLPTVACALRPCHCDAQGQRSNSSQRLPNKQCKKSAAVPPVQHHRKQTGAKFAGWSTSLALGADVKLSIKAELVYNFAQDTQVIANLEASETSDQTILSESLDVQPPAQILSDKTFYG